MIAETQFKERIEKDIAPFQGLLLGLFFITVGMQIDVTAVMKSIGWLLLSVVGIFSIKSCIIFGLSRAFGFENKVALPAALMLGQGGEFLFVIVGSAKQTGLIPEDVGHFMMLVTTLTMIVTPLYALAAARIEKYLEKK
jgi:CPA2 family monovalent cation:H+ antiporter-2